VTAVVFGAGRIGCGFAGELLARSGYPLMFVTRARASADHLNRVGRYVVRLAGRDGTHERIVTGVHAVHGADEAAVARTIADADVVAVSVGPDRLEQIAPMIATGLALRTSPVNVIAFENGTDPAARLRAMVAASPDGEPVAARHGFASALVPRIVARRIGDCGGDEPLVFVGDPPASFVVDRRGLVAPHPRIEGMTLTDDWTGCVCRKLYLFSAGHAMTAYLGHLKGYHYVHSAILDLEIRAAVLAAMREAQAGLARGFGREIAGDPDDLREIVDRFENAALSDPIVRVGRDPQRKLAVGERLVGALRAADRAGVETEFLALACAAALCFQHPGDERACEMARMLLETDRQRALERICGLEPGCRAAGAVGRHWERLRDGARRGGLLLRLDGLLWA
jgi:mannitol-1-phosphate 5-dehydrogenase